VGFLILVFCGVHRYCYRIKANIDIYAALHIPRIRRNILTCASSHFLGLPFGWPSSTYQSHQQIMPLAGINSARYVARKVTFGSNLLGDSSTLHQWHPRPPRCNMESLTDRARSRRARSQVHTQWLCPNCDHVSESAHSQALFGGWPGGGKDPDHARVDTNRVLDSGAAVLVLDSGFWVLERTRVPIYRCTRPEKMGDATTRPTRQNIVYPHVAVTRGSKLVSLPGGEKGFSPRRQTWTPKEKSP
jgi:hypothetical protein